MTREEKRRSLGLAALAFVTVLLVWQVSAFNIVLIPFRYFVTTIHELGHGLAALISGGSFIKYVVYANGAGVATTAGGTGWIVTSAGYLFTALFGAIVLYATNRTRFTHIVAGALGVGFAIMTVLFARNIPAFAAGVLTAGVLILLAWKAPRWLSTLVLNLLAFLTGLNALLDLWGLLNNLNVRVVSNQYGSIPNDAYAMAQHVPILPAAGWAIMWMIIAVGLLGISAYFTFWKPFRNGEL